MINKTETVSPNPTIAPTIAPTTTPAQDPSKIVIPRPDVVPKPQA